MTIDGITYDIEYFLGGDMKFLAIVTGIDSASSTYSCVWCKCPATDRFDPNMEWSATDAKKVKFNSNFSVDRYEHLKRYEEFVSSLGVPSFCFFRGAELSAVEVPNFDWTGKA